MRPESDATVPSHTGRQPAEGQHCCRLSHVTAAITDEQSAFCGEALDHFTRSSIGVPPPACLVDTVVTMGKQRNNTQLDDLVAQATVDAYAEEEQLTGCSP